MKNRYRDLIEIIVFFGLLAGYVIYRKTLSGKFFFILPVIFLVGLYVAYSSFRRSGFLKEAGLRFDNIGPSAGMTLVYSIPLAAGILLIYPFTSNPSPPAHFFLLFFLYPLWGIVQQFMFQSFLQVRLLRLGLGKTSVILAAMAYSFAHWPSKNLVPVTFLAGLFFSFTFFRHRNIISIGISHGVLGALYYQLILGKDVFRKFLTGPG